MSSPPAGHRNVLICLPRGSVLSELPVGWGDSALPGSGTSKCPVSPADGSTHRPACSPVPQKPNCKETGCAPDTEAPSCGPDTSPVFWERMCQDGSFRAAQGHLHICAGLLGKTRNKPTSRLPGTKMASKTAHPSVPKRRRGALTHAGGRTLLHYLWRQLDDKNYEP